MEVSYMRVAFSGALATVVLGAVITAALRADDAKSSASTPAALPGDKGIMDVVGERMSKVFAKFGYPVDVFASDLSSNNPSVFLDYGPYGFKIRKKVVVSCFFFKDWPGTILGVKMGDADSDVIKKLGKPETEDKGSDGLSYKMWSFKQWDGSLEVNFDKDNKMKRAVVSVD